MYCRANLRGRRGETLFSAFWAAEGGENLGRWAIRTALEDGAVIRPERDKCSR